MGKKSPPPEPPDLKPISDAQIKIAEESNELAREFMGLSRDQFKWMQENAGAELEFTKEQADKMFGLQERLGNAASERDDEMLAIQRGVAGKQLEAMDQQMGFANEDRDRWREKFIPMQDQMIDEANAYDTPERREAEASRAMVDVQRQSDAQRNNADARLRSMGIDPSQVRSASMLKQVAVATGANQAMAGNQSRLQTEQTGRALRADAVNMGMGLPSQAAQGYAGSANSANTAVGAANSANSSLIQNAAAQGSLISGGVGMRSGALGQYGALTGSPTQWAGMGGNMYGQASNAFGNAAGTMTQNYQNQQTQWQAGQEQSQRMFDNVMAVGSMAGGMMMAEGGAVQRPRPQRDGRRYANAGGAMAIDRKKFDVDAKVDAGNVGGGPIAPLSDEQKKVKGPSMRDRLQNGMEAAGEYQANRASQTDGGTRAVVSAPRQHQFAQMQLAEGGGTRRGALPVKQARDKIPAMLTEGEYVVPADVVRSVGIEKLDKLVAKYHRPGA